MRTYSDHQLASAIAESHSWRGVLRHLGLRATSGAATRSVRARANSLQLDHSHFTAQRRWTDHQLAEAVRDSRTWTQVQDALGLTGGSSTTTVRNHALRLGLDTHHLTTAAPQNADDEQPRPRLDNLRRAGTLLAAAWFELTGAEVSWPLEPCRYDLVTLRDGLARRIQVKTTVNRSGRTWTASLRCTSTRDRVYAPDEIDDYFIIDGDLTMYLIPFEIVAGRGSIQLARYSAFALPAFESANT